MEHSLDGIIVDPLSTGAVIVGPIELKEVRIFIVLGSFCIAIYTITRVEAMEKCVYYLCQTITTASNYA